MFIFSVVITARRTNQNALCPNDVVADRKKREVGADAEDDWLWWLKKVVHGQRSKRASAETFEFMDQDLMVQIILSNYTNATLYEVQFG